VRIIRTGSMSLCLRSYSLLTIFGGGSLCSSARMRRRTVLKGGAAANVVELQARRHAVDGHDWSVRWRMI
jgi:hypothetical protein